MKISVIIITLNRPDYLKKCLNCLFRQSYKVSEIIVVDASKNNKTFNICKKHSNVIYLKNKLGYGHMPGSRNIGLSKATGEIVAFLDDDAFAYPDWAKNIIKGYYSKNIGGVGGRALNNIPGEAKIGLSNIGKINKNGDITGNFAADPKKIIEVDHLIGCNMTYRRSLLTKIKGFRDIYPGTCFREDSDIAARIKKRGYKLLYSPKAAVLHLGAPQSKGQRFDIRYRFYAQHNHLIFLVANYGFINMKILYFIFHSLFGEFLIKRNPLKSLAWFLIICYASLTGFISAFFIYIKIKLRVLPE